MPCPTIRKLLPVRPLSFPVDPRPPCRTADPECSLTAPAAAAAGQPPGRTFTWGAGWTETNHLEVKRLCARECDHCQVRPFRLPSLPSVAPRRAAHEIPMAAVVFMPARPMLRRAGSPANG